MIDRNHDLSVSRQARILGISRGSVYYLPQPASVADLALMRRIDELHLDYPFAGSRMLQGLLKAEGHDVGHLHVRTLMRKMGIETIYRRPNTSKPAPGHKVYPYLLKNLAIIRPNQVWAMDISYIPMARGFVYLCAVIDWFSRRVLSWRLSITLETAFCIEAVEEALSRYGKPDIFNTARGSQFSSVDFIKVLKDAEISISMDGKLEAISKHLGIAPDKTRRPFLTLDRLKAFRDAIAHGKPKEVPIDTELVTTQEELEMDNFLESEWDAFITRDFMNEAYGDAENLWRQMLKVSGLNIMDTITQGGRQVTLIANVGELAE